MRSISRVTTSIHGGILDLRNDLQMDQHACASETHPLPSHQHCAANGARHKSAPDGLIDPCARISSAVLSHSIPRLNSRRRGFRASQCHMR